MADYSWHPTLAGCSRIAEVLASSGTLHLQSLVVGDANGGTLPSNAQELVNPRLTVPLNDVRRDGVNTAHVIAEATIPATSGPFWIREAAILDDTGVPIAIAPFPPTYKAVLGDGLAQDIAITAILEIVEAVSVTINVDPSVTLATRLYVDAEVAAHAASRDHPTATTEAHGFVELATVAEALAGLDTERAVTPAGVFSALSARSLGMTMITATTTFSPAAHGITPGTPLLVSLWGAGGGAGTLVGGAGGAGGGGGWAMATVPSGGDTLVTIGTGGGGSADGYLGGTGGTTSWGGVFAATGGAGGATGGGGGGAPVGSYALGLLGENGDDFTHGNGTQPIARGGVAPFLGIGCPVVGGGASLGAGGSGLLIPPAWNRAEGGGHGLAIVFWPK